MMVALAFIAFVALLVVWAWLPGSQSLEPADVEASMVTESPVAEAA